jgi:hypothetical protein
MKTAVEWLVNELRNGKEFNDELIEQAKEMEKEQIMDAYIQGSISLTSKNDAEQYYKETYESKTKL